jgi:outer membrane protein assembly factor BamB
MSPTGSASRRKPSGPSALWKKAVSRCGPAHYGEFHCVDAATGSIVWRTREPTGETKWGESVHLTPNGKRVFLFNDCGQLMIARLGKAGYHELGCASLIEPTIGAKEERAVAWAHPACANGHIIVRNDKGLVRNSLMAER